MPLADPTRLITLTARAKKRLKPSAWLFNEIAEETAKDKVLQSVIHHISENWSISKRRLLMDVLPFWSCKDQLSFNDDILYRGDRIVVPATLRKSLTEKLHQAHMGVE